MFQPEQKIYKNASILALFTTVFAQIVGTYEVLSLFKAINPINVLIVNFGILAITFLIFVKKKSQFYIPQFVESWRKILNGLKRDKFLCVMSVGLLFFLLITILFNIFLPVFNFDSLTYHLNRVAFWMSQGSLAHFDIPSGHNLVMPINSEILYFWVLTFLKKDIGLQFFSFAGYLMCIFSIYNILAYFGYSERTKLWSIFIFSAFASVIAQASSVETDILIAGLILASIYLYLVALKESPKSMVFFSALAFALAIGTKSPAVIAFPAVFLGFVYFSWKQKKLESLKWFVVFLALNFVLFSSYNYILNFIDYQNFLGSESARVLHGFRGGFKAFVANYIRYIFMMFDFSGFRYSEYLGSYIVDFRSTIFEFLRIPSELGVEMTDDNIVNNGLLEVKMGAGLLGFLLFLPSVIYGLILNIISKIKHKSSRKLDMLFVFGLMFFVNIACLSFSIAYMVFSVRFLTTMIAISAPVLAISYIRKNVVFKYLILFFVMSYFLVMPLNLTARPFKSVLFTFLEERTLQDARERIRCSAKNDFSGKMSFCELRNIIKTTPKGTKCAILPSENSRLYPLKMLDFEGYKIDVLLPEKFEQYDLSAYDYLIKTDEVLISTVLLNNTKNTKVSYEIGDDGRPYFRQDARPYCTYLVHGSYKLFNPKNTNDKEKIVASFCVVDDDYIKTKGFNKYRVFDFQSDFPNESNYMTIYKNVKK